MNKASLCSSASKVSVEFVAMSAAEKCKLTAASEDGNAGFSD